MVVNIRKILINICCFLILLYPFNSTIANKIYPSYSFIFLSIIGSMIIILLLSKKEKFNKIKLSVLAVTILLVFIELINNQYLNHTKVLLFTIYLFLPFIISVNKDSIIGIENALNIFCIEHITFTYIPIFFKNFYLNKIIPFLTSAQTESLAASHFKSGFNPGLTTHYSTNGMYLSIITIYLFSIWLKEKNLRNTIFVAISIVALLVTGKRAHAIFTILTMIVMFFIANKDRISKRLFKFIFICFFAIMLVYVAASFIPQVTIVYDRFMKSINGGTDILTGRTQFYELAFKMWKEHPLIGNGWGSFSNQYQIFLFSTFGVSYLDAHNVYIQLLCETGILGLIIFISIMAYVFYKTYKLLKHMKNTNSLLSLSFGYQCFFLLYCFSGNPLYDPQCYVMYFVCIGLYFVIYMMEMKKNEADKNNNICKSS